MQPGSVHETWSSRLAFLLASIGAAVGLGNLWKFPYTLGNSGGSAFVLIYLVSVFFIATPIMLSEMLMGRRGRMSPPETLRRLAAEAGASAKWSWLGWMGIVGLFLILSFFSVIAGWSLAYVVKVARGTFTHLTPDQVGVVFNEFLHSPLEMIAWHFTFMAVTVYIVSRGINSGIEKAIDLLMPALFLMLVGLVGYAAVTGDFARSLEYLFKPDFSKITPLVALAAIGQAFFSVNVGVGAVLTYSAYLPPNVNLTRSALFIATGDTLVALLAGLAIFPIVFAYGLDPGSGPGLIFVTLSAAFAQMPGGVVVGTIFFLLVFVAALTSSISMLEVMISRAEESARLTRQGMAVVIGFGAFLFGLTTVFSFNLAEDIHPLAFVPFFQNATFFNLLDFFASNIVLPVGGFMYALFAGWWLTKETTMAELGIGDGPLYRLWRLLIRYIVPLAVAAIFVTNLI